MLAGELIAFCSLLRAECVSIRARHCWRANFADAWWADG
ncbi:hypothetical protein BLL52_1447, partial [Rhodoferax antarcticus ANT.BR]